ncbi:hypothetical protein [Bombilactobacillus bombi]|uniref:hypothetical protein n=1 Tax=Bombilactobacillus bombi TaxID=1303590 RepID=UPI0011C367F9|nr:hypothetical protein [Bombilactobacillus bombi]
MFRIILVIIIAYLLYLIHKNIKSHSRPWPIIIASVILIFVGIGAGGNATTNASVEHRSASEVQQMKNKYLNEKESTSDLQKENSELSNQEQKEKSEKDKILIAYNQQKPQFQKENEQKQQQEKLAQEQKEQQEAQQKQQEEQQRQAAEAQQQQQEQQRRQQQNQTPAGQPQYSNDQQGQMVWVAPNSGKKYHYDKTCRGLRRANGNITQMTEQQAKSQGYSLCGFEGG